MSNPRYAVRVHHGKTVISPVDIVTTIAVYGDPIQALIREQAIYGMIVQGKVDYKAVWVERVEA